MRLTSMSDAFITQMNDPKMKDVSFEDRFALLVDVEYNNRKSNGLKRLIRNAGFDQPEVHSAVRNGRRCVSERTLCEAKRTPRNT
jgi:hypothetical protein